MRDCVSEVGRVAGLEFGDAKAGRQALALQHRQRQLLDRPLPGRGTRVADLDADGLDDLFLCNRASVADAPATSGGLQRLLRGVAVD